MIELFKEIPPIVKLTAQQIIDEIISNAPNLIIATEKVALFNSHLDNKDLTEFIDFYFKLKLEQMKNENNHD